MFVSPFSPATGEFGDTNRGVGQRGGRSSSTTGAGIRTCLYELTVTRILHGDAPRLLVVEEPAELLDGTPVIVDGMEPLREGEQAVWYLVAGEGPSQPYYAVVNAQGRVTP